ncbi:hypothetical protein DFH06DRAFT_1342553 [Mycena polygramma]|nr:hypothetical protein DFH06DRAFT_1342553 [Mycena polygramma]
MFPPETAQQLLGLCTRLESFGSGYWHSSPALLPVLAKLPVQRLSVMLDELFGAEAIQLSHPHLCLCGFNRDLEAVLTQVPKLPVLTHLCLDYQSPCYDLLPALARVLEAYPRLVILVVQWYSGIRYQIQSPHIYDDRFVKRTYDDYWRDWEAGAKGIPDFWSQTEDFVARKRNGEIAVLPHFLPPMIEFARLPADEQNTLKKSIEQELERLQARGKIWGHQVSTANLPSDLEIRVVDPHGAVTCDWVSDRLNINTDGGGKIENWVWG